MMKKSVMDRPMFKGKNREEIDVENVGIMSGFKDDMEDDMDLEGLLSELGEGEEDMYDSAAMLDRRPDSPEILMNNLRGDMQSIDSRREELADLVGYNAAMETPDEVLALLQSQMSGGIGTLPAGPAGPAPMEAPPMPAGMPPDMGAQMPPPMPAGMPPGMPPDMGAQMPPPMPAGMMPPMNMAAGGIVQRFSEGSDEDAVTPVNEDASSDRNPFGGLTLDQLKHLSFIMQQNQPKSGDLRSAVEARAPLYRELLGADSKDMTQGQALLDLTQGFLNLTANRGPQGEVLRGSGASRFAGAFRGVPGQLATRAGDMAKQEQAIKLAALQSAEKSVESDKALQLRLAIARAKAKGSTPFGTGLKGSAYNQLINLSSGFGENKLTPQQEATFMSSLRILQEPEFFIDDLGFRRQVPLQALPNFVTDVLAKRGLSLPGSDSRTTGQPPAPGEAAGASSPAPGVLGATYGVRDSNVFAKDGTDLTKLTLWEASDLGTGIISVPSAYIARFPLMGGLAIGEQQANAFLEAAVNRINRGLAETDRFSDSERQAIEAQLNISPSIFLNAAAFRQRLIGLDRLMLSIAAGEEKKVASEEIPRDAQNKARAKLADLNAVRDIMGLPKARIVRSQKDFDNLDEGERFWLFDKETSKVAFATKKPKVKSTKTP
jgi:hypothetical protein